MTDDEWMNARPRRGTQPALSSVLSTMALFSVVGCSNPTEDGSSATVADTGASTSTSTSTAGLGGMGPGSTSSLSSASAGTGGTGAGGAPDALEVAVVSTYLGGLFAFTIDPTNGALDPVANSPVDAGGHLYSVAIHPKGTFVYTVDNEADVLLAYRITPITGVLEPVGAPLPTDGAPITVAVDPKGRFVYVGTSTSIDVFTIDPTDGALSLPEGASFAIPGAAFIAPDPSGAFVYVSWTGAGGMGVYGVEPASGALSAIPGSPLFPDAIHGGAVVFHPSGSFLYNARGGSNGYATLPGGGLTLVPGPSFDASAGADPNAIDLAITPKGQFAYAVASSTGKVFSYAIDPTHGGLTPGAVATGALPYSAAVEPSGRFLYVANDGGTLSTFPIHPTNGSLMSPTSTRLGGLQPQIAIALTPNSP
jgi:6-phosphogluconolactonase